MPLKMSENESAFLCVLLLLAISPLSKAQPKKRPDLPLNHLESNQPKNLNQGHPLPISSRPGLSSLSGIRIKASKATDDLPLKGGSTVLVLPFQKSALRGGGWCKTRSFRQRVHADGCLQKYVTNSMCFGQCLSFYIPKHFYSCSSCLPDVKVVKIIELQCVGRKTPMIKKINIVKSCRCQPCERFMRVDR